MAKSETKRVLPAEKNGIKTAWAKWKHGKRWVWAVHLDSPYMRPSMGSRVVSLRKAQVQQHSTGRSTVLASGGVPTHRNRMFWKQTPHVHTARRAWWRTWVVSQPPHDTFTCHKYHGKHTSKYCELERLSSDSKGARRQPGYSVPVHAPQTPVGTLFGEGWGKVQFSPVQFEGTVNFFFLIFSI